MNLFLYTMSHFLSKLLRKLYLVTHWEWAWLFCTGENSQHGSAAYLPRGRCMVVLCSLCAVYHSFCASSIKLRIPGCSTVLSWLHLQVQSKRTQIHMLLFFHKDETIMHLPHDMQQSMHYSYVQNQKPALMYWMFKWPTLGPVQYMEQLCRASGPCTMHWMCSYMCTKGFQL